MPKQKIKPDWAEMAELARTQRITEAPAHFAEIIAELCDAVARLERKKKKRNRLLAPFFGVTA